MSGMRALTDAEIAAFLEAVNAADGDGRAEQKRRLFCQLLLYTGCELNEARAVTREQIDLRAGTVTIITRKTKILSEIKRVFPMPSKWVGQLNIVAGLADKKADPREQLWPMSRTAAWYAVTDAMSRATIKGKVATPTGLRHSFALRQLQSGKRLREVRELLGNSSDASMFQYMEALSGQRLHQEVM